jgi:hypothetical protein
MTIDETIQQFYRRIRVADVEGFGALFAPDAVNHDPGSTSNFRSLPAHLLPHQRDLRA